MLAFVYFNNTYKEHFHYEISLFHSVRRTKFSTKLTGLSTSKRMNQGFFRLDLRIFAKNRHFNQGFPQAVENCCGKPNLPEILKKPLLSVENDEFDFLFKKGLTSDFKVRRHLPKH